MKNILIIGYGKIGKALAELLSIETDFVISVLDKVISKPNNSDLYIKNYIQTDIGSKDFVDSIKQNDIVVCATPFYLNQKIATFATKYETHYFDFTEDVENMNYIVKLSQQSNIAFIPQCGLAPGFINVLAYDLYKQFDKTEKLQLRVGALPMYNSNRLHYNITWSTDGLINEYANPSDIIQNGRRMNVPSLQGVEDIVIDGEVLEAFYTSGGVSTLIDTLENKIDFLDYKTIRYRGHNSLIRLLMIDLKLSQKRELFKELLEDAIPLTHQDKVYIYCSGKGYIDGQLREISHSYKVLHEKINQREWTAIEKTTTAGCAALVYLFSKGKLKSKGLIKQEDVNLSDIIHSPFGKYLTQNYTTSSTKH